VSGSPEQRESRLGWWIIAACFAMVALILGLTPGAVDFGAWSKLRPHTPDFSPLAHASWLVRFHVATIVLALLLGPVQFALPKGTRAHRVIGWIWVSAMGATAIASLFIRDMNHGGFSPIHIFSAMTLIGLPMGIAAARSGRKHAHQRAMIGLYIGVVIAGLTAVAPGRLVWDVFFG
jgi:uncharacterized membrane protein